MPYKSIKQKILPILLKISSVRSDGEHLRKTFTSKSVTHSELNLAVNFDCVSVAQVSAR